MADDRDKSNGRTLRRLFTGVESRAWHGHLLPYGLLVLGIVVYVTAQMAFLAGPLWNRDLPPEPDDSLAYLTKTVQMEECFYQDCEALKDLRRQMAFRETNPTIRQQRSQIVGRIFQVYHPLFSAVILKIAGILSIDPATAYKLLWQVSPILFGFGFACWISVLWGPSAAGLALIMLAFSIFPDTGLHYFVPGNCALALALFMWSRILSRKGDAPLVLVLGALALVLMHPVGRIYAVMGAVMAVSVYGIPRKPKTWVGIIGCLTIVALAFVVSATVERPMLSFRPEPYGPGQGYLTALGNSIVEIGIQFQRTEPALLRSPLVFFGAAVCGFLAISARRRKLLLKVFAIISVVLMMSLFYVLPRHPADLFLRMLTPMVALLFGGVGAATWFTFRQSLFLLRRHPSAPDKPPALRLASHWPLAAFTVLVAFMFQIVLTGTEGWMVLTEHMTAREPVVFSRLQPERLISESRPGDRVLYDSMIIMPFYFVNGAMSRGAVFYPAIRGTSVEGAWLNSKDLRYAVLFNPAVATQRTHGFEEEEWWQSKPSLRYSALDLQKPNRTLSINGKIPMNRLMWLQLESSNGETMRSVEVFVDDVNADTCIEVVAPCSTGNSSEHVIAIEDLRAGRRGWVRIAISDQEPLKGIRIMSPRGKGSYSIGGLRFGIDRLRWPWNSKANMIAQPRVGDTTPVKVSFDPQKLMPSMLKGRKLTVLDDNGSSVLIRIAPSQEN